MTDVSAASLCRPPFLPRMPCFPWALSLAGDTHPLALGPAELRLAGGSTRQPGAAVAASQVPPLLAGASEQAGFTFCWDALAPFAG